MSQDMEVRVLLRPLTNEGRSEASGRGLEARLSWIMSLRNNLANWGTETVSFESSYAH